MGRSLSRAARLRQIENLLFHNAHGMRIVDIAEACGVDRRTIYRDIDLLSDAGVPIWQDGGKYGVIRGKYLATVRLNIHEATALYIATRLLAKHADEHNPHIISALNKLSTAFPSPLSTYIARTAEAIRERPLNRRFMAVLENITLSWAENTKVRLQYRSPRSHKLRQRVLSPYMLEPSRTGALYIMGFDEWAQDTRTFNLDRLEEAERLKDPYEIPEEFNPAQYLENAWGIMSGEEPVQVSLQFSAQVATFIHERLWHASQQIEEQADGSVMLHVTVSDFREMRPWIRSWGAEVKVMQPAELREELAEEARRLAELYSSSD